jgi:two-component system, chemotaxis family, sensor kinase CheA
MSAPEFDPKFLEVFLDDYFADADHHLRSVQPILADLEDTLATGDCIEKNAFGELFRSFHTLKGISAIAGVPAAETLAHHTENYLRLLRDGEASISREGLLALMRSAHKLEKIVTAKRHKTADPDFGVELALLDTMISRQEEEAVTFDLAEATAVTGEAREITSRYLFTFVSSAALASRNINVSTVRERLGAIGRIIDSKPVVIAGGQVAVEFLVETDAAAELFDSWADDGVDYVLAGNQSIVAGARPQAVKEKPGPATPEADLERSPFDGMLPVVCDLVVTRAKLADQLKSVQHVLPSDALRRLEKTNQTFATQLRDLRAEVTKARTIPIDVVFARLRAAAHDLARPSGKKVHLEFRGTGLAIDKLVVLKILDPLIQLLRSSVSHSIEPAGVAFSKDKPENSIISLAAETRGEAIVLEIHDDGAGLPGGDVVRDARRAVGELRGSLDLETVSGVGTKFRITLPIELAIVDALIVAVDEEQYAVPQFGVREVIEVREPAVRRFENNELLDHRGAALRLIRLNRLFGLNEPPRDEFHAFVVGDGPSAVAIAVDRILGRAEIVVKEMNDPLTRVPGISGAAELGNGRVILVLDPAAIALLGEEYI